MLPANALHSAFYPNMISTINGAYLWKTVLLSDNSAKLPVTDKNSSVAVSLPLYHLPAGKDRHLFVVNYSVLDEAALEQALKTLPDHL